MPSFEETEDPAIRVREMGGRLLVAGGAARDFAIRQLFGAGRPFPDGGDLDLVVFGLDLEGVREALCPQGQARIVWRRDGGWDSTKTAMVQVRRGGARLEAVTPRTARPGDGRGEPRPDPAGESPDGCGAVAFSEGALARDAELRDFTANAMYFDPLEGRLLDPLGGLNDVRRGFLAPCSARALADDPVRMLRAMSLVARRPFAASRELLSMVRASAGLLGRASPERFWPEWKAMAESPRPHLGLAFLAESGLISRYPELDSLRGLKQHRNFHPEGSVWNHTVLVVQAMTRLDLPKGADRAALVMTALLHDVGKTLAARRAAPGPAGSGMVLYPDHAALGAPAASRFLKAMAAPERVAKAVSKLTARHMDSAFRKLSPGRLRWIARELAPEADLSDFWAVAAADWNGRSPWPEKYPYSLEEFLEPVGGLAGPPRDLVTGGDLVCSFGVPEGPEVGRILRLVRSEHDEGRVDTREGALEFVAGLLRTGASGTAGPERPEAASGAAAGRGAEQISDRARFSPLQEPAARS
ncbi:MAG: HD domain-containing protein [Deltaproteobacteria bacterium]|nr:HD domain-containing protein [Deltaproteobacteria bacterium]